VDGAKGYSSFDVKNSQSTAYVYDFPFVVITISYSHEFDSICYSYCSFFKYFNLKASQKDTNVPSSYFLLLSENFEQSPNLLVCSGTLCECAIYKPHCIILPATFLTAALVLVRSS